MTRTSSRRQLFTPKRQKRLTHWLRGHSRSVKNWQWHSRSIIYTAFPMSVTLAVSPPQLVSSVLCKSHPVLVPALSVIVTLCALSLSVPHSVSPSPSVLNLSIPASVFAPPYVTHSVGYTSLSCSLCQLHPVSAPPFVSYTHCQSALCQHRWTLAEPHSVSTTKNSIFEIFAKCCVQNSQEDFIIISNKSYHK